MVATVEPSKKSIITTEEGKQIASVVYTDPKFAKRIIQHFEPQFNKLDTFIDPCKGDGAFYDNLPGPKYWCELQEGRDFLQMNDKAFDWAFVNPPWQGKYYAPFMKHCYEISRKNVVVLAKLFGVLGTQRRLRDMKEYGFGIKEIILCDWKDANFTYIDGSPKLAEGFLLSVVHLQKGYTGGTYWNYDWTTLKNQTDTKQWKKDSEYVKSKNGVLSKNTRYGI